MAQTMQPAGNGMLVSTLIGPNSDEKDIDDAMNMMFKQTCRMMGMPVRDLDLDDDPQSNS